MQQKSLFESKKPLAEILRPTQLEDVVGDLNFNLLNLQNLQSSILWGPPGTGKTTLAKIIANHFGLENSTYFSAVNSGITDFKNIFNLSQKSSKTLLMIDEIHHLNKFQQDVFLPHIESGAVILIGMTTENPSFVLRTALLSRCKVIPFKRLSIENLLQILIRVEQFYEKPLKLSDDAKTALCEIADGDARYLLNRVEELMCANLDHDLLVEELGKFICKKLKNYDKKADEHYNLISAFHKSVRGSDPDAALYWFSRMLQGGEEPLYVARRLLRAAIEDVGIADPNAMSVAMAAVQSYEFLGSPEGELAIVEAIIYVATSPKSNAVYNAYNSSINYVAKTGSVSPPSHIINAPNNFMKEKGFAQGYVYDHDAENAFSGQDYFPEELDRPVFYKPNNRGFEKEIIKRIDWWNKNRNAHSKST